jgi:hypothetical protein
MKNHFSFRLALAGLLILAASAIAGAQGVRYDGVATLDTGRPAQGIGIRVCSSGSTGTPCTPLASIFSDSGLSVAITQPGLQSDAQGNYNFYAACNKYDIQLSGNGVTTRTMKDVQLSPCGVISLAQVGPGQYTNATTAFTNVPNISFSALANHNYFVACDLVFTGSATTSGPKFQITGPAAPTFVQLTVSGSTSAAAFATASTTSAFSTPNSALGALGTAGLNLWAHLTFGLENGVNAGTVALQAAANGTGTLTIQPISSCIIYGQ